MSDTREESLLKMHQKLRAAKAAAIAAGFGYEVIDAFNELLTFAEFELDELETEYQ